MVRTPIRAQSSPSISEQSMSGAFDVMTTRGQSPSRSKGLFERIAQAATQWAGNSGAFLIALSLMIAWLIAGPIFGFSSTWQWVANTTTTMMTFLMVFLIQRSQKKESLSIQLKLNEIVAALEGASNRLIDVERLSEADLARLHKRYQELSVLTGGGVSLQGSHSVEDAKQFGNVEKPAD